MITVKITKQEVINLNQALKDVGELSGINFTYAVAKNLVILDSEVEVLRSLLKPSSAFSEYDTKRLGLAKEYAIKENGEPKSKQENGVVVFEVEDQEAFNKAINELKDQYTSELAEREKQLNDFNDLLKTEISLSLHEINKSHLPENITAKQLTDIIMLVVDDTE